LMRYFEWLFPIHKYMRLRLEVSALRAWLTPVICILFCAGCILLPSFQPTFLQMRSISGAPGAMIMSTILSLHWEWIASVFAWATVAFLVPGAPELIVSLVFVRKQPGRRRPLCTWQTLKYVLLGSQTWLLLAVGWGIACLFVLDAFGSFPRRGELGLFIITGWLTAMLTSALITAGATAVQAALAVIALQDDRRCTQCGYFLIGLTTPRCPECGTPFDPAKLGRLAVSGQDAQGGGS